LHYKYAYVMYRSIILTLLPGQLSPVIPPWLGTNSTSESWGVNNHTRWWGDTLAPYIWFRTKEMEINATLWAMWLKEDLPLLTYVLTYHYNY